MDDSNPAQNLPIPDASLLAQAAAEFASYPGMQTDASAKEFLDRFPLSVIFSALQSGADVPGLENALVSCLERIFGTKYGSSFIPHYMPFVQAGLQAYSQMVRCLACKTVSCLLVNVDGNTGAAVELVIKNDIYPLLLNCLIEGNELVAAASTDAIVNIARSPGGIDIVFPTNSDEATHLIHIASRCSSLARIRVLALIVKLFSISSLVASAVYDSKLLGLLEAEVNNKSDMLTTLSALELLYELAESPHGIKFVLKTTLLHLLTSIISNTSLESILRSRAILISGRLLSSDDTFTVVDESSVRTTLLAIDARLELLKDQHADECESAFEALGQIGAHKWWDRFGNGTPELRKLAIRILSQCISASGCERNWSIFEHIHSPKRNRLEHQRLNDLVFVHYNLKLRERDMLKRTGNAASDPISLENINILADWVTEEAPLLTIEDVDGWTAMEQPIQVQEGIPDFDGGDEIGGPIEEDLGANEDDDHYFSDA